MLGLSCLYPNVLGATDPARMYADMFMYELELFALESDSEEGWRLVEESISRIGFSKIGQARGSPPVIKTSTAG